MSVPPIPDTVYSILGPIPVVLVANLEDSDGEPLLGKWEPEKRRILLCANVHPITSLVTLWHERVHQMLWDSGAGLDQEDEERVCDAISPAIVAELLNGTMERR